MSERKHSFTKILKWIAGVVAFVLLLAICLMRWGGYLLESSDALPAHVDAAIVLEGSMVGERARLAAAMQLLRQGVPERVLLPLPQMSYWGEPVLPMVRHFLETNYGSDLAARVESCDVGADVDSTLQEAQAINRCIEEHHWTSVLVVTSNYHTRRAGIIWRKAMRKQNPSLHIAIYSAADPEFRADGWWRRRWWAKTWVLEFTKLIWTETVGR